jgi:hypothetical protein
MSKHLGRKAAYYYTHTWNRTFGEKVGMYPKYSPMNDERYKRAGVFMKALASEMKNQNVGTIYRGLSKEQGTAFVETGVVKRKTFSSFTTDFKVAQWFSDTIILAMSGRVPSVKYNQTRYVSMYNLEKEVLLPPGVFTRDRSKPIRMRGGRTIIEVSFKPIQVNIAKKESKANAKYAPMYKNAVAGGALTKNTSVNNQWRRQKANELEKQMQKIQFENMTRVQNLNANHANVYKNTPEWHKKDATIQKMKNRLRTQITTLQKRVNAIKKGLRNVPSYDPNNF